MSRTDETMLRILRDAQASQRALSRILDRMALRAQQDNRCAPLPEGTRCTTGPRKSRCAA